MSTFRSPKAATEGIECANFLFELSSESDELDDNESALDIGNEELGDGGRRLRRLLGFSNDSHDGILIVDLYC